MKGSEPTNGSLEVSFGVCRHAASGDWGLAGSFAGLQNPPQGSPTSIIDNIWPGRLRLLTSSQPPRQNWRPTRLARHEGSHRAFWLRKLLRTLRSYCESESRSGPCRNDRDGCLFSICPSVFQPSASWGTSAQSKKRQLCFLRAKFWRKDPLSAHHRKIHRPGRRRWDRMLEKIIDERLNPVAQEHEARGSFLPPSKDQQFLPFSTNFASISLNGLVWKTGGRLQSREMHLKVFASWAHSFDCCLHGQIRSDGKATDISFSSQCGPDWSIDPDTLTLQKLAPGIRGDGRLRLRHRSGWNPSGQLRAASRRGCGDYFSARLRGACRHAHSWIFGRRHRPTIRRRQCSTTCANTRPALNAFVQACLRTPWSKAFSRATSDPARSPACEQLAAWFCRDLVPMQLFRQQKSTEA